MIADRSGSAPRTVRFAGRPVVELIVLGAAVGAPLAPALWGGPLLLAALLAWWWLRPPRRELAIFGLAVVAAAALLLWGGFRLGAQGTRAPAEAYGRVWAELEAAAAEAGADFPEPRMAAADPLTAFEKLAARRGERGLSLLLVNPDGDAVVWSGPGLLHDPRPGTLPVSGAWVEASFSAVTLFAVEPLEEVRRPWRLVAARSFATSDPPLHTGRRLAESPGFAATGVGSGENPDGRPPRWSVSWDPQTAVAGAQVYTLPDKPVLIVEPAAGGSGPAAQAAARTAQRVAWAVLGLGLLVLGLMRGAGMAIAPDEPAADGVRGTGGPSVALLTALGLTCGALAAGAGAGTVCTLLGGAVIAALGLGIAGWRSAAAGAAPQAPGWWRPATAGVGLALLLAGAAWALQLWLGPIALGAELLGDGGSLAIRLGFAAASFGVLIALAGWVGRRGRLRVASLTGAMDPQTRLAADPGDRFAWLAVGALVAAASVHDLPWAALPLLAAGAGASVRWTIDRPRRMGAAALAVLALLSCLLSAVAWETAQRHLTRQRLASTVVARLAPPDPAELAAWEARARSAFADSELESVTPQTPAALARQDLAFALWKSSPLARVNAASALRVEPAEGEPSTFSFGLPLDEAGFPSLTPSAIEEASGWPVIGDPPLAAGEAVVSSGGAPWGTLRWWLVPRPGFLLRPEQRLTEIEVGLLRGGGGFGLGGSGARVVGMPTRSLAALYDDLGQALVSPWPETPPMPAALRGDRTGAADAGAGRLRRSRVATPDGIAWGFSHRDSGLWSVVYLPLLGPLVGLERVAIHAVGTLLVVFLLVAAALLLAVSRSEFRALARRGVRSYSKRLLVLYTVLLLVPLLLLNFLLVAAAEDRLERQQRAAGEAALASVQRQVADLLAGLAPGFGLDTSLDDELLSRISRTVQHEVNLYWRSSVYASSKGELFAAGLLPRRIPGDVHARLAFLGYELASRVNRVGRTSYLELYSPVRPPGGRRAGELVLSVPLLAQQDEVARELGNLRRQAFVVTVGLFALLTAVGARLARNFTRPLMDVVRGTRRIAAGATSLDLSPRDIELAALVEAVDEMAGRIAEGRRKLLREKEVVDRMVESITSGVVSVDEDGGVLMTNRVAAELLGVREGPSLADLLRAEERLSPVSEFVDERLADRETPAERFADGGPDPQEQPAQQTVRLVDMVGEEREWSLVWVPVPGGGEPAALLVVEDATETLRGQRLEAWAEMARIIAHEIKNPLTPLQLNVEHLRQVWRDRRSTSEASDGPAEDAHFAEILDRCTANALVQVEELRQIATEFSTYSSIPRIDPQPGDLAAAMEELAEGYRAAPPKGVSIEFDAEPPSLPARFDRKLLGRAVRNLIENAIRASAGGGEVRVRVERTWARPPGESEPAEAGRIAVSDRGPGVADELLARIFDPYFSTHDTGTGLGLPIARQVAEEHGGGIAARNRTGGGLEVAITIPL